MCRYKARGLNSLSAPANEIECEQIIIVDGAQWSSYVWRRGSVPLRWSQTVKPNGVGTAIAIEAQRTFEGSRRCVCLPSPRCPVPAPALLLCALVWDGLQMYEGTHARTCNTTCLPHFEQGNGARARCASVAGDRQAGIAAARNKFDQTSSEFRQLCHARRSFRRVSCRTSKQLPSKVHWMLDLPSLTLMTDGSHHLPEPAGTSDGCSSATSTSPSRRRRWTPRPKARRRGRPALGSLPRSATRAAASPSPS